MNKKGFLDISFSWIFAILVGGIILFGAIYGMNKFINLEQQTKAVKGAVEIGVLLDPLETSFEVGKSTIISMPVESKIYTDCNLIGNFGEQELRLSEKTKGVWSTSPQKITFSNKYLFANSIVQGKTFNLFSKPFEFPFKTASVIYLTSSEEDYCFVDSPREIKKELTALNQENIFVKECPTNSISVCFGDSSCEINVQSNFVEKGNDKLYFKGDALMFAAIFSEKESYECQLKRLLKRVSSLSDLYLEKSTLMFQRGCNTNYGSELNQLKNFANSLEDSSELESISTTLETLEHKNQYSECKLW